MVTLPGLIDSHVHFRVPGQDYKEDWITGSAAALAGGVTAVMDMPSNQPPILTAIDLEHKKTLVEQTTKIQYRLAIGITDDSIHTTLASQDQACAIKVYLQPHATGMGIARDETLHTLYQGAEKLILIHDDTGPERILKFVQQYKKPTYFCHVSTATELAAIAKAKAEGLPVFAEVTLHHLWLDQTNQQLGKRAKVNPPLRTAADREALWQGIKDGVVDTIATDHAPHTIAEKDSAEGAAGFPSIEFFLPLLLTGVAQGKLSTEDIVRCCVTNPTKLFGFGPTGQVVVDETAHWIISEQDIKSKCAWSPYLGMQMTGRVQSVILP